MVDGAEKPSSLLAEKLDAILRGGDDFHPGRKMLKR